ncbi:MAG TPA: hypothetical protein VGY75_03140 [Candidatus Udaeobacter sp.]|nr:hypothetical protein [Candidatus Udaeobacter sp.]
MKICSPQRQQMQSDLLRCSVTERLSLLDSEKSLAVTKASKERKPEWRATPRSPGTYEAPA